jgi:hypothetical protein
MQDTDKEDPNDKPSSDLPDHGIVFDCTPLPPDMQIEAGTIMRMFAFGAGFTWAAVGNRW